MPFVSKQLNSLHMLKACGTKFLYNDVGYITILMMQVMLF